MFRTLAALALAGALFVVAAPAAQAAPPGPAGLLPVAADVYVGFGWESGPCCPPRCYPTYPTRCVYPYPSRVVVYRGAYPSGYYRVTYPYYRPYYAPYVRYVTPYRYTYPYRTTYPYRAPGGVRHVPGVRR
jgi:hypothetical protein